MNQGQEGRGRKKKVLIALSGGIDSAVSAYLLIKKGYNVEAAFMKNWSSTAGLKYNECPWLVDRQDALRVAAFLRIPLHTLDFEKQYENKVLKYFFSEYKKGRTPNPDVMCNKEIKFKLLYDWARNRGFDYLATGHYARVVPSRKLKVKSEKLKWKSETKKDFQLSTFNFQLARSADEFKDQTYFIYNIKSNQLPHILFPVGGMKKTTVRALAKKIGLPNAEKKESMGLCFVGRIRLKDFLQEKIKPKPGPIVLVSKSMSLRGAPTLQSERRSNLIQEKGSLAMTKEGVMIGQHQGLHNYTIGQRQGIAVGAGGPYYVVGKNLKRNILYVTNDVHDKALLTKEVEIHSVNWIVPNFQFPISNFQCKGRFRHQGKLVPLTISNIAKDHFRVKFETPQKALASGQSLVVYNGKICLGGGVIV